MGDSVADSGGGDKLADFVEDWLDGFGLKFWVHTGKFVSPEVFESLVLKGSDHLVAKSPVGENFDNMGEVGPGSVDQG